MVARRAGRSGSQHVHGFTASSGGDAPAPADGAGPKEGIFFFGASSTPTAAAAAAAPAAAEPPIFKFGDDAATTPIFSFGTANPAEPPLLNFREDRGGSPSYLFGQPLGSPAPAAPSKAAWEAAAQGLGASSGAGGLGTSSGSTSAPAPAAAAEERPPNLFVFGNHGSAQEPPTAAQTEAPSPPAHSARRAKVSAQRRSAAPRSTPEPAAADASPPPPPPMPPPPGVATERAASAAEAYQAPVWAAREAKDATEAPSSLATARWFIDATGHAAKQCHSEAIKACLTALSGPDRAVQLVGELLTSWETDDRKKVGLYEDEKRSLIAQLMAAKERSTQLRQQKDQKDDEIRRERQARNELEEELLEMQLRLQNHDQVVRENARLKGKLRAAEAQAASAWSRPKVVTREDVVKNLAELECAPLRNGGTEGMAAIRKKLLLKWHPDKQPSAEHTAFATQVMQEMQNRDEWSWGA